MRTRKKINEILPVSVFRHLHPAVAKRVYTFVWNAAVWWQNPIWIENQYLARRTGIELQRLVEIRDYLVARGLMQVAPDISGCMYEIIDPYQIH